jgi:hypothetical protein
MKPRLICCLAFVLALNLEIQGLAHQPLQTAADVRLADPAAVAPPRFDPQVDPVALVQEAPANIPGTTAGTQPPPLVKLESLPNTAGQVLRQYDLRPYTHQISTTLNPQQAVVDWVLRETGTEMWFNEPLGLLSANREQLVVYHTPEIQAVVERMVDRFVSAGGRQHVLGIRLVSLGSPNWRTSAYSLLQPIDVQTPGIEGWMIRKENAAILLNQLRRRADFSEHGGGDFTAHDGQKTVMARTRPIEFVQAIRWTPGQIPPYFTVPRRIDEGYNLEISFLTDRDQTIEAVLKCNVDQVERLQTVNVDAPDLSGRGVAVPLQIPQLVSWRLQERFRWPADQVLLLSCGVVASPSDVPTAGLTLQSVLNRSRGRADALLMIEYKGVARQNVAPRHESQAGLVPVQPLR